MSAATPLPRARPSPSMTAPDACGGTVTISHDADVITAGSCANRYSITRTYHAKHVSGNTTLFPYTTLFRSETGPVIGTFPNDTTVSCASGVPAADDGSVRASAGCGGRETVSQYAVVITADSCANRYSITRTYHAKDVCGNTTSKSQTITVDDGARRLRRDGDHQPRCRCDHGGQLRQPLQHHPHLSRQACLRQHHTLSLHDALPI